MNFIDPFQQRGFYRTPQYDPFFFGRPSYYNDPDYDEEFESPFPWGYSDRAPQRTSNQNRANRNIKRNTNRRRAGQPVKNLQKQKEPEFSQEQKEKAAILIQSCFRRYQVKKILLALRNIRKIFQAVEQCVVQFQERIQDNTLRGEKLRLIYAGHEEDLTKLLLQLDGISVARSKLLRNYRKKIVQSVNSYLHDLDQKKPEIVHQAKLEQEQLRAQKLAELQVQMESAKTEIEKLDELSNTLSTEEQQLKQESEAILHALRECEERQRLLAEKKHGILSQKASLVDFLSTCQ